MKIRVFMVFLLLGQFEVVVGFFYVPQLRKQQFGRVENIPRDKTLQFDPWRA